MLYIQSYQEFKKIVFKKENSSKIKLLTNEYLMQFGRKLYYPNMLYLFSKATPETPESLDKGQSVIPAAIGGILSACLILVIAIVVLLIRYLLYKVTKEWNKLLCFTKCPILYKNK